MTILTTPQVVRRPLALRPGRAPDLSDEEAAAVKRALRFLRTRVGTTTKLAAMLQVKRSLVERALSKRGRPGAGLAIRVARAARVSIEDVIRSVFPPEGACPHCGR